ncbi:hypothetical protein OAA99_03090, partial [Omnitrophica bacterium]|nr:hypothetical protein [Candidatus Omnitrophota bacterium]
MNVSFKSGSVVKEFSNYLANFRYSIKLNKPLLALRIARDYLRILLFGKVPLRYVDVAVTYDCNLKCIHCSAKRLSKVQGARQMQVKDYEALARECHKLGVI